MIPPDDCGSLWRAGAFRSPTYACISVLVDPGSLPGVEVPSSATPATSGCERRICNASSSTVSASAGIRSYSRLTSTRWPLSASITRSRARPIRSAQLGPASSPFRVTMMRCIFCSVSALVAKVEKIAGSAWDRPYGVIAATAPAMSATASRICQDAATHPLGSPVGKLRPSRCCSYSGGRFWRIPSSAASRRHQTGLARESKAAANATAAEHKTACHTVVSPPQY
jgi:hypothetical protein